MTSPDFSRLGLNAAEVAQVNGGDTGRAWRVTQADGSRLFVKQSPPGAVGMAELEAAGLQWLGDSGVRVPGVIAVGGDLLALPWIDTARPSAAAAVALGRDLARLHSQSAPHFGCPPPMQPHARSGWVGAVRVPFTAAPSPQVPPPPQAPPPPEVPKESHATEAVGGDCSSSRLSPHLSHATLSGVAGRTAEAGWAEFYVDQRLVPVADEAHRVGGLTDSMRRRIDDLCDALLSRPDAVAGPAVPPAPIHGDLWAGNVMWQQDGATLIDPAAVGGHPETDLAMLHLFGLPHLDTALDAYEEVRPLPTDWRERIPLHQVFPLVVHAVMFGAGYGAQAADAATLAVRAAC